MAYTALETMREKNAARFGIAAPGPIPVLHEKRNLSRLEKSCLHFLHEDCEDLRFDPDRMELEDADGAGLAPNQIPYNMEKDVDRLCLENAVHRFLQSGDAHDAFDVYFCYMEMFMGSYGGSRKLLELLSEFESNSSVLLMKHRDHYVHSVYVFLLGLALYRENGRFRRAFARRYGQDDAKAAAHDFLKYWGLCALFHDIGYPLELPFEQVKNYFGNAFPAPYVNYSGTVDYLQLPPEAGAWFGTCDVNELLANVIADDFGPTYAGERSPETFRAYVLDALQKRPTPPGDFMDHAYFSAVILQKRLTELWGSSAADRRCLDAVSAIAVHNSFFKYVITNVRDPEKRIPLSPEVQPMAYLLCLCDELQCWDRVAYGQNSRRELHPMQCDFEFGEDALHAVYVYDRRFEKVSGEKKGTYAKMTRPGKNSQMPAFVEEIENIVCLNGPDALKLSIETRFERSSRQTRAYISESNFLHLYNFAVALNARYVSAVDGKTVGPEEMDELFEQLSLEYKLSNLQQAKAFAGYLERINCFYTDRAVAYEPLEHFSEANMDVIGPLEHDRWLEEKVSLGWIPGNAYEQTEMPKVTRELCRMHKLMVTDYNELDKSEQDKDTGPMDRMLSLIEEFDGLRVYRL